YLARSSLSSLRCAPRFGAKTGRHGLGECFFLLLTGCEWRGHEVAEQEADETCEHDGARPEMHRPRDTTLKTQRPHDGQVEEVAEVEDRWHHAGEQAQALWSFSRGVESLVEQVSYKTSQHCTRQKPDHHFWTEDRHQAGVGGEDER